jgi:hypothetical protein
MSTQHHAGASSLAANAGAAHEDHQCPVQKAAKIVGAMFLLVGILGFVPGITSHFGDMKFAGHESGSKLLGVFQVSVLHNIVHLLFGIAGLVAAKKARSARTYLVAGGVIYLVLFLYGLIMDADDTGNFVPVNNADDWLHLLLGLGMVALGAALWNHRAKDDTSSRTLRV